MTSAPSHDPRIRTENPRRNPQAQPGRKRHLRLGNDLADGGRMTIREQVEAIKRAQSALYEAIHILDALGAKKTVSELQTAAKRLKELEYLLEYEQEEQNEA